MKDHFRGKVVGNKNKAYVKLDTANEFTYPAKKGMESNIYLSKMRSATELDNMLDAARFAGHQEDDGRHPDAVRGWDKYETIIIIRIQRGDVFYDATKIKDVTEPVGAEYGTEPKHPGRSNILIPSISENNENDNLKFQPREYSYEALPAEAYYKDGRIYDYDFLVAQKDMKIVDLPSIPELMKNGGFRKADIVKAGKRNAGRTEGQEGDRRREIANAQLGVVIGDIVKNVIPINGLKSTDQFAFGARESREYFQEMAEKFHYWDWKDDKTLLKFKTVEGHKIALTREQALGLYATWKREHSGNGQNAGHLEQGGFVYEDAIRQHKKDRTVTVDASRANRLTQADMNAVDGWLTQEQKAYGDAMVHYLSATLAERGNAASMALYGIKKFRERYYYPNKSSSNDTHTSLGQEGRGQEARLKAQRHDPPDPTVCQQPGDCRGLYPGVGGARRPDEPVCRSGGALGK